MSKGKSPRREASREQDAPPLPPARPLTPRKGLFVALCAVFAVWVGCLTTLYFKTVYGKVDPHAHRAVDEPLEKSR
jgi:hypothetical protein